MRTWLLFLLIPLSVHVQAKELVTEFKKGEDGSEFQDWNVSPDKRASLDTDVLYDGQFSARIDRTGDINEGFSHVIKSIPLNFDAKVVELRAKLRTHEASGEGAYIMLRQDVGRDPGKFNISQPFLRGTNNEWQSVRVSQRVEPGTDTLVFGAVLGGSGEAWVSDIQLWVDGERLTQLPASEDTSESPDSSSLNDIQPADVDWSSLEENTIHDIAAFIQVWGFLKYFHPDVSQGTYTWDRTFIESTHGLLAGSSLTEVLSSLLEQVGVPEQSTANSNRSSSAAIIEEYTPDWLVSQGSDETEITEALNSIYANRGSFNESTYAYADGLELANFSREEQYQVEHLDQELRLLGVARLWNILEYWFPYPQTLQDNGHADLPKLVRQTVQAESHRNFQQIIQGMLAKLEDGHADMTNSIFKQGACYLPFTVRYIENQFVISQLHQSLPAHDVQPGDAVIAIAGESLDEQVAHWLSLYPASNDSTRYYKLANDLLARPCGEPTTLTLRRNGKQHQIEFTKYHQPTNADGHTLAGSTVQSLDNDITYLKVPGVDFAAVDEAINKARQSGKLIIDVRGYPSEFILYHLGNQLTDKPLPFAKMASAVPDAPGTVSIHDHTFSLEPVEGGKELKGIAILVDETTLSQSEFSVLAWRELPNATVIGSTTAGAVGNIRVAPLPDGTTVAFTGLRILNKEGEDVQHVGIVPDVYRKPSIEDLRSGREVVLEKAIELLNATAKR